VNAPLQLRDTEGLDDALKGSYGWWFRGVTDAFAFLEGEHGYVLTQVQPHFRGPWVRYAGRRYLIMVSFEPEPRVVEGDIWVAEDLSPFVSPFAYPRVIEIPDLLMRREPRTDWSGRARAGRLSNGEAVGVAELWAGGIRAHAKDLLAGRPLRGIRWPPREGPATM